MPAVRRERHGMPPVARLSRPEWDGRPAPDRRGVLFVSNGHGETAIAARIGVELRRLAPDLPLAHLPLVGTGTGGEPLVLVGPRRAMPSGGLVAMGNVRNIARDVRAGFLGLLGAQTAYLRGPARSAAAIVAVGDAYGLALALLAGRPVIFVGTAKSAYVAPYGATERVLLRRAARVFVRDAATADALRRERVRAEAPGNTIVDLAAETEPAMAGTWLGLLPGSRAEAYDAAITLARIVRELRDSRPALLSIAPTIDAARVARELCADGWTVEAGSAPTPFSARCGDVRLVAWSGSIGALLSVCVAAIGQAGTANEAAAARGVPVFALAATAPGRTGWYRERQRALLGEAVALVPADPQAAVAALRTRLADGAALAAMAEAGRARMGPPGGTGFVARAVLEAIAAA